MDKKIEIQKDKQNSRLPKDRYEVIYILQKRYKSINVSKKMEIQKDNRRILD